MYGPIHNSRIAQIFDELSVDPRRAFLIGADRSLLRIRDNLQELLLKSSADKGNDTQVEQRQLRSQLERIDFYLESGAETSLDALRLHAIRAIEPSKANRFLDQLERQSDSARQREWPLLCEEVIRLSYPADCVELANASSKDSLLKPPAELESIATAINRSFPNLDPTERIQFVMQNQTSRIFATTSGGIQSAVLLNNFSNARESACPEMQEAITQLPIVFLNTGNLFDETIDYINQLRMRFELNVRQIKHGLTPQEFEKNRRELMNAGKSSDDAFDELSKVRPMAALLASNGWDIWIAGNRRDQAKSRRDLPFAEISNGTLKVYPLADVTAAQVSSLISSSGIEAHPLSHRYASVGNKHDTAPGFGADEKQFRHGGVKTECGLHVRWAKQGLTFRMNSGETYTSSCFPLRELAF